MKKHQPLLIFLAGLIFGLIAIYFIFELASSGGSANIKDLIGAVLSSLSSATALLTSWKELFSKAPKPPVEKETNQNLKPSKSKISKTESGAMSNNIIATGKLDHNIINQNVNLTTPKVARKMKSNLKPSKKSANSSKRKKRI